jgi:tetratricopeptide (TPR) repeat protein
VSPKPQEATGAIEEIEGIAERAATWVGEHLALVAAALVVVLAGAAGVATYVSSQARAERTASDALDIVHSAYLRAMGASPGDLDVPELANPTAAKQIREEYATKYGEIADDYAGTVAGVLARLEQGNLSEAGGDLEGSIQIWRDTLAGLSGSRKLEAIVHQRIGQAYEDVDQWLSAAEAHEAAAQIESYPLRYWAMADAARCFAQAGERDRARSLAARLDLEAPSLRLPDHVRTMLRELRNDPGR